MGNKLQISYCTAKKILTELLSNQKLREDEDIKNIINNIAISNVKEQKTRQKESSILIDSKCNIYFPDYCSHEIKISYLPKTVYIFFLLHPEGAEFKNMDLYAEDLYKIYMIVSENKNIEAEKVKMSINKLVEPGNNRIYEICSIIRRTLLNVIPSELIGKYTIIGKWGGLHSISLDKKMIKVENRQLKEIIGKQIL